MEHKKMNEELIYQGRIFDLVRARVRLPNGKDHAYDLVRHRGAVVILPIDRHGNILFVRQFRVGAEKELLELPAGLMEESETPETSAAREVREETGMAAAHLEEIGQFYMVPGYSTEKLHAFLATGLSEASLPVDEDEFLEQVPIPIEQAYAMASRGEIEDGKTLAVLLMARPKILS
mgnify:CR=1 FL=1